MKVETEGCGDGTNIFVTVDDVNGPCEEKENRQATYGQIGASFQKDGRREIILVREIADDVNRECEISIQLFLQEKTKHLN